MSPIAKHTAKRQIYQLKVYADKYECDRISSMVFTVIELVQHGKNKPPIPNQRNSYTVLILNA